MIAAIRISGMVGLPSKIDEALYRLRLRRKYSLVLLKPSPENLKLLKKIRNQIAYGDINPEVLEELIEKRGQLKKTEGTEKKIDAKKIMTELEKKKFSELEIKPFFRLHPPRGGIDSKKHFGVSKKAVLGDNKKAINDLIRRML